SQRYRHLPHPPSFPTRRSSDLATPLIVRGGTRDELIANGWETVVSYDPTNGKELWRCEGVRGWAIPSAVAGHDMVFVTAGYPGRSEVHTSELQSRGHLVCRLLL